MAPIVSKFSGQAGRFCGFRAGVLDLMLLVGPGLLGLEALRSSLPGRRNKFPHVADRARDIFGLSNDG